MTASPKPTRVSDAYTRLKDEILSNRMPPGFQAPEPEIALRLGMSRTPVREALIRLQAEGLVDLIPRRGARVLPIEAQDMQEIYEIFTALEPDAAAAIARSHPTPAQLAPLVQATQDMEQALQEQDLDAWAQADDRFHRSLHQLHGNQRLSDILETLYDQAHRARIVTLRLRDLPHRSTQEHRAILDALQQGDPERAHSVFRQHRDRAAQELLAILRTYKLPQL